MAERLINIRGSETDERLTETIRYVYLKSTADRSRSATNGYRVRIGVGRGDGVDWIGEWDQAKTDADANARISMVGDSALNYPLGEEDEIILGVTKTGSPGSLDGMSVEVRGGKVGELGDQGVPRTDGDFPPGAEVTSPLFTTDVVVSDRETQGAIDRITERLNEARVGDWSFTHALTDAVVSSGFQSSGIQTDADSSGQTISSTSYGDGNVSVTIPVSLGKTVRGMVCAECQFESASSTARLYAAIGDGTSEYREKEILSGAPGDNQDVSITYAFEITDQTTFSLRLKKDGAANNCTVEDQSIDAFYVETDS